MKKIGICNNKGGVGKTTFCFCLGGAFAEMGRKVLMVDMDQQGSLSSSFVKNINELPYVITDALLDDQKPMKAMVQRTAYENIDLETFASCMWQDTLAFEDPKASYVLGWFHNDFLPESVILINHPSIQGFK